MKKINETLEKLNSGSCTKSVRMIWKIQIIWHSAKNTSRNARDGQRGVERTGANFKKPRIKATLQILIVPYYRARVNRSRGEKCWESLWQRDLFGRQWKSRQGARKHDNCPSIRSRWWNDEKKYFPVSSRVDRSWLPLPGLPHDDRHLHKARHDQSNATRWKNKKRLSSYYKSVSKSSWRTRKNKYQLSEEYKNQAQRHNGQKPSRKVGVVEPKLKNISHNHLCLFHHLRKAGGKTLDVKTLDWKITNGTIINGAIINGDPWVRIT